MFILFPEGLTRVEFNKSCDCPAFARVSKALTTDSAFSAEVSPFVGCSRSSVCSELMSLLFFPIVARVVTTLASVLKSVNFYINF